MEVYDSNILNKDLIGVSRDNNDSQNLDYSCDIIEEKATITKNKTKNFSVKSSSKNCFSKIGSYFFTCFHAIEDVFPK